MYKQAILPRTDKMLGLMREIGFDPDAPASGHCSLCGNGIVLFRDRLSEQEYSISGACQLCQDVMFAEVEGDGD